MPRSSVLLASAFLGIGVSAAAIGGGLSSGAAAGGFGDFGFAFMINGGEPGFEAHETAADAGARDFEPGGLLTSGQVMEILTHAGGAAPGGGSAYRDADLVAYLVDMSSGEVVEDVIARCATLDFGSAGGALFEQEVTCGATRFSYGVSERGIEIFADGRPMLAYPLEKGVYRLNGVPFIVN